MRSSSRQVVWHPFTQMAEWSDPLVIQSARGAYLIDSDGKRYLDGVSSLWVNVHGHRHPMIDRAIRTQLGRMAHSTLLGVTHPPAMALARALVRLAPGGLTKVFFSDDGATAVEVALKMAFQYWKQKGNPRKETFVYLDAGYHGDTLGAVSVGGIHVFHETFKALMFKALRAPSYQCFRCPWNHEAIDPSRRFAGSTSFAAKRGQCQWECVETLEGILRRRHKEIAALIVEPKVQGAGGIAVAPAGYLRKIRALGTRNRVLLIADEVAVGFGRTGRMFACEHERVRPDFLCLAKGITGGYLPLAATLTTEEVYHAFLGRYEELKTFFHGHSYGGNPLGAAAALANLDVFRKEQTLRRLEPKIRYFRSLLAPFAHLPYVGDVRQCGMIAAIEIVKDKSTGAPFPLEARVGHRVCLAMRQDGVLLRPLGNVIVLIPPLSITTTQLRTLCRVVYRHLAQFQP